MEPDEQKNKLKREILAAAKQIVREKGVVSAKEVYIELTGERLWGGKYRIGTGSDELNIYKIRSTLLHNGYYVAKSKGCGNGRTTMYAHRRIKKEIKDE